MKILLHMGQGKTGTTALQQSLHTAADLLRARKVLYPRFGGNAIAHHLLVPLCGDPTNLPAWSLENIGGPEAAIRNAQAAWSSIGVDVRRLNPDLLVLSSEFLWRQTDGAEKARLAVYLSELSCDITPILYIRHPVDHYRSRLQEWLKAECRPLPPTRLALRESILETEAAFLRPPALVAFDRSTLHGGDIIQDFATRFLTPWVDAADLPPRQANAGLSAEALVLMVRLRAEGGNTPETARRVARQIQRLADLDRSDPPARPLTLLPEVAEAALRAATCHRWLAETGRLHIPGLDVSRIDGAAVPDWLMTAPPETLFAHDPDRLGHLRRSLEDAICRPGTARTQRKPLKPSKKHLPRLRDLLLRFLRRQLASPHDRNTGAAPTRAKPDRRS